jgi:hypothetical protein
LEREGCEELKSLKHEEYGEHEEKLRNDKKA